MTPKVFRVNADYIMNRSKPNYYYVIAETRMKARRKFEGKISWLKIISIEECPEEEAIHVVNHPMNYIVW